MGKQRFVFSPSNMSSYRDCPRRFQAQSLTKEIQWKASKQKSRGQLVHSTLDTAVLHGLQAVRSWPEKVDIEYINKQVTSVRQNISDGAQIFVEKELCINKFFKPVDWWDDDALLRARADLLIIPPAIGQDSTDQNFIGSLFSSLTPVGSSLDIVDFKTGKKWDDDDFQLRVETLLAHLIYDRPIVNYSYWYVDTAEPADGSIDFRNGLSPVQDIINLMKEMKCAIRDNYFPPKSNKFCKYCDFHKKPECGL